MPNILFSKPVACHIRNDKYARYRDALAHMGLPQQQFHAAGITDDGAKVIADPNDLAKDGEACMINAKLVEFDDPAVLELLRSRNIRLGSA
jgi:hypothetical protein